MILPVTNFSFTVKVLPKCFGVVNLQTLQVTQRAKVQDLIHQSIIFFFLSKWTIQELSKSLDLTTRLLFHLLKPHEKHFLGILQASSPIAQDMFPNGSIIHSSVAKRFEHSLEKTSVHNLARRVLESLMHGVQWHVS
ncbi:hypothetical protein N665_0396s0017 [Sinapis alba]|nr:hypothetical protein N665_0396s0017 [Sinapis alba]